MTHNGVTYYTTSDTEAGMIRDSLILKGHTDAGIVAYGLGYAIQYRRNGPYVTIDEGVNIGATPTPSKGADSKTPPTPSNERGATLESRPTPIDTEESQA